LPEDQTLLGYQELTVGVEFKDYPGAVALEDTFRLRVTGCETYFEEAPLYETQNEIIY
jgi:hypothetical protein